MRHRRARARRGQRGRWVGAATAAIALAAVGLGWLALPRTSLVSSRRGLARIVHVGLGERLVAVRATIDGRAVPVVVRDGRIVPEHSLDQGAAVSVVVRLAPPRWLRWLLGRETTVATTVDTPVARLLDPIVIASHGAITSDFSMPVSLVRITTPTSSQVVHLSDPTARLTVVSPSSTLDAGVIRIEAAPLPWENLAPPTSLTFFRVDSADPIAIVSPSTSQLQPSTPLTITLSQPVTSVFGSALPRINPVVAGAEPVLGTWSRPTPYSLVFTPTTPDFWPGEAFELQLPRAVAFVGPGGTLESPRSSLTLTAAQPSILALQELLAELDYLPLQFHPATPTPLTVTAQAAALLDPPRGSFSWRWSEPSSLTSLWQPGVETVITTGAVMAFEHDQGLDDSGLANPLLWPTLIHDLVTHTDDPHPYSYILVSKVRPETLWLYVDGQVTLTSLVNTGIPGLNTPVGTWPIYLRFVENYMSGTNPNGTPYHDLVHWINYFNASVAVHGFPRANYGYPQSLGCVELPVATAAELYPQVHIGTLVTVLPNT